VKTYIKKSNIKVLKYLTMDYKKIDNIDFDGIDYNDYPDFCDAFIVSAYYDGVEMTEEQLEALNNDSDYVYERLQFYLY